MKDAARIDTAREIFTKAFTEVLKGRPADSIVTAEIKNRRYMGSSDRRAVTEMIWQSFRNTAKALWFAYRIRFSGATLRHCPFGTFLALSLVTA